MMFSRVLPLVLVLLGCFSSYSRAEVNQYGVDCSVTPHLSSCSYENGQWYGDSVDEKNISDDGWVGVPLEFGFPFHGETFTYSWMHSNGVVSFLTANGQPTIGGMCCDGIDLENTNNAYYQGFSYFIAPLWTDIINMNKDIDGDGIYDNGQFVESFTDDDGNESQRYLWQNQSEFYDSSTNNTVGLEIFDTGKIDIHHHEVEIRNHSVFVGVVGDQSAGEIETIDYYSNSSTSDYTVTEYENVYSDGPDYICNSNPLSSTSCPGYQQAYTEQQCKSNPLYDTSCDGYADAYAEQQYQNECSADPLYDSGCDGYETAYFNQQCDADPLYDSTCTGYAEAYFDQQCVLDALYDSACPGYSEAYATKSILDAEKTNAETQVSTTQTETVPVTDPEEIGMPSTTGDSAVDAILKESNDVLNQTFAVEDSTVETIPTVQEVEEPSQETETVEGTDSAGEVEELVASVETEESDDTETSSDELGGGETDGEDTGDQERDEPESEEDKERSKNKKMKKIIAAKAIETANAIADAVTLEQQRDLQNRLIALIGYNPQFVQYGGSIPGVPFYNDVGLPDAKIGDSRKGLRNGLAQQLLHEKMIDMQYEKE